MLTGLRKWFAVLLSLFLFMFVVVFVQKPGQYPKMYSPLAERGMKDVATIRVDVDNSQRGKWRGFSDKQISQLSKLGKILYLDYDAPLVNASVKNYTILIWKHGLSLERRHIKHYSDQRFDPFENCSVKNCLLSYKDEDVSTADLVIFHLHRTKNPKELPQGKRNPNQFWTFLTDESPYHTFLYSSNNGMKYYDGLFNWSMTYRMNADIPVPYGRTVVLEKDELRTEEDLAEWDKGKKQDVLIAIMGSNCGGKNNRWGYVKELEKHITVDKYGACGTFKCPGHFTKDCEAISTYKFYLAFENSNCDEYVTEKLWWNGYGKDAIPIVMGTSKTICKQLLPPQSYIHVEDFATPRDLANYINYLNETPSELQTYFEWKRHFKVLNEHGYLGTSSIHYCRICEALNYNDKKAKTIEKLGEFWSTKDCHERWDAS